LVRGSKRAINQIAELVEALLDMHTPGYGKKARLIFDYLVEQGTVIPEEYISKNLGLKSNEARRILQILAEQGIISFRRMASKDRSLQGWYIDTENIESVLITRLKRALEKLKIRLEYEKQPAIYYCPRDRLRFTMDQAMMYDFICPRCGSMLEEYDGSLAVKILEKRINEIEEMLKKIGVQSF